jgi:hypothetical protein
MLVGIDLNYTWAETYFVRKHTEAEEKAKFYDIAHCLGSKIS